MRRFARLYAELDATTKTNAKVDAMAAYFAEAPPADAAWALFFLTGGRLKRLIGSRTLRAWAQELAGLPDWLVDDSYAAVGDTAETVALLVDATVGTARTGGERGLAWWMEQRVLALRRLDDAARREAVVAWWHELDREQRFVLNKLLTGGFRVGVSQGLVVRAIAKVSGLDTAVVSHRLMGRWQPTAENYEALLRGDDGAADASRPYPFFLASQLDAAPEAYFQLLVEISERT